METVAIKQYLKKKPQPIRQESFAPDIFELSHHLNVERPLKHKEG